MWWVCLVILNKKHKTLDVYKTGTFPPIGMVDI